jgi:hypothetical protein
MNIKYCGMCWLVYGYRSSKASYWTPFFSVHPEDRGFKLLRQARNYLPIYTASYSRKTLIWQLINSLYGADPFLNSHSRSAVRQIIHPVGNKKLHNGTQKDLPQNYTLKPGCPSHPTLFLVRFIWILSSCLLIYVSRTGFIISDFLKKVLKWFLICPNCTTYPTHFILLAA